MYTLEHHHRCIHSVVVIVAPLLPPSVCQAQLLAPLLIKLTQVKVRMVFDMKCMKLTGKHIAPHFYHTESVVVSQTPPFLPLATPLCATYIHHNQLPIFLLLSRSLLLSLLLVLICDMSSSSSGSKCCFYQTPLASTPLRTEAIWHCWSSFYE